MKRINNIKMPLDYIESDLKYKAAKMANIRFNDIKYFKIVKKSIDARKKSNIFYIFNVDISHKVEKEFEVNYLQCENVTHRPIIVGFGPSGMFCAYILAKAGFKPIVFERGESVDDRVKTVENLRKNRVLNTESNVQFGEGGAGTFSDGKLNTLVKSKYNKNILKIFVECGAPKEIEYLAKPHIGTDNLIKVVKNLRNKIIELGGEINFNSKVEDLIIENGKIKGVVANDKNYFSETVVLALGHSARDTFEMIYSKKVKMEQKEFAVGFRIEHKKVNIDNCQYGKFAKYLPSADYKLVSHTPNGRGVYTFCMCPGGEVVLAASEDERLVVNGMSYYKRNMENSNSALLCNVYTKDFESNHPLAGMEFQRLIEEKAYIMGGFDYKAPVQLVGDFIEGKATKDLKSIKPSIVTGYNFARLDKFFSNEITESFKFALKDMPRKLREFSNSDAVLTGIESRSSSPVRIVRGKDFQSNNIKGLYPIGEGCGYAGGIMSASIDGYKIALAIIMENNN